MNLTPKELLELVEKYLRENNPNNNEFANPYDWFIKEGLDKELLKDHYFSRLFFQLCLYTYLNDRKNYITSYMKNMAVKTFSKARQQ